MIGTFVDMLIGSLQVMWYGFAVWSLIVLWRWRVWPFDVRKESE